MRGLIETGALDTVHDVSDGGLLVAIAEMAMAGGRGVQISAEAAGETIAFFFGEDQGRYVVGVPADDAERILGDAGKSGVRAALLGYAGGDRIAVSDVGELSVAALRRAHEGWFPAFMGADELPPTN